MSDYKGTFKKDSNFILHYGTPRHSGRYPWGSGENPYQRSGSFASRVNEMRKQNPTYTDPKTGRVYTKDTAIAKILGMSTTEFRTKYANEMVLDREFKVKAALDLLDSGYSRKDVVKKMGLAGESSLRSLLNESTKTRMNKAQTTAEMLKEKLKDSSHGMIDVGKGVELGIGISAVKLNQALDLLEQEGYHIYKGRMEQVTNKGNFTTLKVLCNPEVPHRNIFQTDKIDYLDDVISYDEGKTFKPKFQYPESLDSSRLQIKFGDEGGVERDGLVEIRPNVPDLDLGNSKYAQVRIMVDGTHYIKGMAVYNNDLPEGIDVRFNVNKKSGTPIMGDKKSSVLKPIKSDPESPFGSLLKEEGGQYYYFDEKTGKEKLGLINKTREEGDWTNWSDKLPSQFLAKQSKELVKKQLDLTVADKAAEFDEIMSVNNPTLKRNLLNTFADERDSDAIHLKAASLPRQKYHVILPCPSLKDNEVYAPKFNDGDRIALVRYPHAGRFEIPELVVNNKNKEARKMIGTDPSDAICINGKVAKQLSGADFDGDTVITIPTSGPGAVKIKTEKPLPQLQGFDPDDRYSEVPGMKVITHAYTQKQMGVVSNLITDMTIKGAGSEDISKAVKHSMVIIDAEKHRYNYKLSEKDNDIETLKRKYQGHYDKNGNWKESGAATLLSRAKNEESVAKRVGSPKVNEKGKSWYDPNRPEGALVWKSVDESYTTKTGKVVKRTQKSTQMAEVDDAYVLSSGHPIENLYADYANSMKSMANKARLEAIHTPRLERSNAATKEYAAEVASLEKKLTDSLKNKPRERRAQAIANAKVKNIFYENPDLTKEEKKKIRQRVINEARESVGAHRVEIDVTDREWKAIQSGAISDTKLSQMLPRMDIDKLRERATPRSYKTDLSQAQKNRIAAYRNSGFTIAEIANIVGVSPATVSKYSKGGT